MNMGNGICLSLRITFIHRPVLVACLFLLSVISFPFMQTGTANACGNENLIVQPGQQFLGKSYSELVGEWTNWLIKEPLATNPASDVDGEYCDRNQHGPVWFLASTFQGVVNRTCRVPLGKAIFVSLGGVYVSFAPEFTRDYPDDVCFQLPTDLQKVRCDVNNDVPVVPAVSLAVSIDGEEVKDLFAFRAQSPQGGFTLRIPDYSYIPENWGFPSGNRYPAVADGYFLLLKPLKPGKHSLKILMTNADQSQTGVNYTLIVGLGR